MANNNLFSLSYSMESISLLLKQSTKIQTNSSTLCTNSLPKMALATDLTRDFLLALVQACVMASRGARRENTL